MRRFIFAIALTVIAAVPAFADVRIMSSAGGPVISYLDFFSKVRRSGERVIIDGPCLSACNTCAEHHSAKPDLRHVSRCARLSRTHRGRPVWTQIPLTRNHTRHQCDLSPGRPHLDQAQWRLDAECHSSQGPRARENVSALPLNFSYGDALAVAGALALIGTWTSTAPAWANSSVRITSSPASNASSRPTSMR